MQVRFLTSLAAVASAAIVMGLTSMATSGQDRASTTTASREWPTRLPDGQPDVQGDWDPDISGMFDITDPRVSGGARFNELLQERRGITRKPNPSRIVDPPDGKIPYQPWALERRNALTPHIEEPTEPQHIDPLNRCLPAGPLREMFHAQVRIAQFPGNFLMLLPVNHVFRVIPLEGRPHVGAHTKLWMGDSRGHWEGTTLVVDVTNLNAKGRLDTIGDFSSDAVHVVERFAFLDAKTMRYQATIDDPGVYTRPWTIASRFVRRGRDEGEEYWEDACHEGERSAESMILRSDGGHIPGGSKP
jgi:hypothetical protein